MRGRALLIGLLLVGGATGLARGERLVVRAGPRPDRASARACEIGGRACTFGDARGENAYVVTRDTLARLQDGREVYRRVLAGGVVSARLAVINAERTQIAVVLAQEAVATGAMFSPGAFSPEMVQRKYLLSIRNPKTGEEIKAIDLGMLKPEALTLSPTGDYAWVVGDELQLRRREVRAYQTRSGTLEHMLALDRKARAELFDTGYVTGGVYYGAVAGGGDASVRRHASANPYSIAEFTVTVGTPLNRTMLAGQPVAVLGVEGVEGDVREMLESVLAVKLAAAGLHLIERKRIKALLQEAQFQNLGITDSASAAELGRMANARFLVFGSVRRAGSITQIALQLTEVESGGMTASIGLECRDCTPDDYGQGLGFLVSDWVVAPPP